MEAVIETQNLKRHYGEDETLVRALDGVDLKIEKGEFTAIVGPSGSGKSTLLNLIGGLDHPSTGTVAVAKASIGDMGSNELSDFRRDHIGFVFQAYNLIPVLTAHENVEYVMLLQGVSPAERQQRTREVLKEVGLEDQADRRPDQLSGGQQQRVAVARAIVSRPSIILADEPTANLDSATGEKLLDMMAELNKKHQMSFIFSTHDPMVMERARRVITLKDGKIVEDLRR